MCFVHLLLMISWKTHLQNSLLTLLRPTHSLSNVYAQNNRIFFNVFVNRNVRKNLQNFDIWQQCWQCININANHIVYRSSKNVIQYNYNVYFLWVWFTDFTLWVIMCTQFTVCTANSACCRLRLFFKPLRDFCTKTETICVCCYKSTSNKTSWYNRCVKPRMVTCEIKLFQPLKLFRNYFSDIGHVGKYS